MPVISFCGESFTVDHAVKGADYVHGYDANSNLIVSLEGITDFSRISYDGEYMAPSGCLAEACNDVKYCDGVFKTRAGATLKIPFSSMSGVATVDQGGTGSTNGATGLKNLFAAGYTVISSKQCGAVFPTDAPDGTLFFLEVQ